MVSKIDWTLVYTLITALFSTLITLGVVLWNLSAWKTKLILKIDQNKQDIDNLGNSVRKKIERDIDDLSEYIAYKNEQQDIQINHMSKFLEETTQYRHPTIQTNEKRNNNKRR